MRALALLLVLVPLACRFQKNTPEAEAGFTKGNALLKAQQFPEAVKALQEAERLHYTPLTEVLVRLSEAYAGCMRADTDYVVHNMHDSLALHYMEAALQMGYPQPERFLRDPAFLPLRGSYWFHETYASVMGGRSEPGAAHWKEFRDGFPQTALPLVLDTLTQASISTTGAIAPDFEDYIPAIRTRRFSRMMDETFFYIAKVREDPSYIAVIYGDAMEGEPVPYEQDIAFPKTLLAVCSNTVYYLATYTPSGKAIDKMAVAGHQGWDDPLKIFTISTNMDFSVADDHFRMRTVKGNFQIAGSRVDNVRYYRINAEGKFEGVHDLASNP
jgi:hypothetical protein